MKSLSWAFAVVGSFALLAACASPASPEGEPPTADEEVLDIPSDVPAAPAESASVITIARSVPLAHVDGYQISIDFAVESTAGYVADITDAAPGFTDFKLETTQSFTAVNQTPGRVAPGDVSVSVHGVYAMDSGLCSGQIGVANTVIGIFGSIGTSLSGTQYCLIGITAPFWLSEDVPVDGQLTLDQTHMLGNLVTDVPEAANAGPVLNAPLGLEIIVSSESWKPTGPFCETRIANVYGQAGYSAVVLSGDGGILCT